jgi:hypothetical protein
VSPAIIRDIFEQSNGNLENAIDFLTQINEENNDELSDSDVEL